MTTEPSARVTVNEKPMPGVNTDELTSDANTKKTPPSATAKLTVPVPALSSAPSRLAAAPRAQFTVADRKSTRLNSSHSQISYAVFCLKKKKKEKQHKTANSSR